MNRTLGALYIVLAVLACCILRCSNAGATPILLDEPCQTKTLITRKPAMSPGKPSPIIAWVTVRSGKPKASDKECTDETVIFDLPEPEIFGIVPELEMPYEPEYEEPEEDEPTWWFPRYYFWPDLPRYIIVRVPPPTVVPPVTDTPPTYPVPPTVPPVQSVPEPATLALMGLGLLGCATFTRKRRLS